MKPRLGWRLLCFSMTAEIGKKIPSFAACGTGDLLSYPLTWQQVQLRHLLCPRLCLQRIVPQACGILTDLVVSVFWFDFIWAQQHLNTMELMALACLPK
jgi:hypothetical protein